jgi:two-component system response regulator AtoC
MLVKSPLASDCGDNNLPPDSALFGRCDVMQNLKRKLLRVCVTSVPVMLQGEMCAGKSVLCRFIHQHSIISAGRRILPLNCSALSDWSGKILFDAALKSSSVIADTTSKDQPNSSVSTLFLNQVGDLPFSLQVTLSHLLADYDRDRNSDQSLEAVRILSTSTQDLRREVRRGRFRRDLFDRLAVVTIEVPPLRKRLADLPAIVEYLRLRCSRRTETVHPIEFPPDLLARMMAYSWPGNFCELESFVSRHIVLRGDYSTPLHQAPWNEKWNWDSLTGIAGGEASKRKT